MHNNLTQLDATQRCFWKFSNQSQIKGKIVDCAVFRDVGAFNHQYRFLL